MASTILNQAKWTDVSDVNYLSNIIPQALGNRHAPICHGDILGEFKNKMDNRGLNVNREQGLLSQDELKYVYVADIASEIDDLTFTVGFINFNDRSKSFTGLVGERVFVCSNEMFQGEMIESKRKHTTNVLSVLDEKLETILDAFNPFRDKRLREIGHLKSTCASQENISRVTYEMLRNGTLSNTDIKRFVDEWENPRHEDFAERNFWSLQNAGTEIMKRTKSPIRRVQVANEFNKILHFEMARDNKVLVA